MASADPLLHGKLAAELIKEKDQGLIMIWTQLGLGFYLKISPSDLSQEPNWAKVED